MRKPFIRKTPLAEKIRSYPYDLLLWINEARLSIEWDQNCHLVALPLGTALTGAYIVLTRVSNYYADVYDKRENRLFQTDYDNYELIKKRALEGSKEALVFSRLPAGPKASNYIFWAVRASLLVLFAASVINAVNVFFFSFREYLLLNSSTAERPPKSPSVVQVSLSNANDDTLLDRAYKYFYNHTKEAKDQCDSDESFYDEELATEINLVEKSIWQLNVWNPSKFPLFIAATFSPISLLFVRILSHEVSVWKLILVVFLVNALLYFIVVERFLILLNDKQLLYQEMFLEYNNKFVKPKTSILKKDVEIDATYGPDVPAQFLVKADTKAHLGTSKLKVFITHDINGKPFNSISLKSQSRSASPHPEGFPRSLRYQQFLDSESNSARGAASGGLSPLRLQGRQDEENYRKFQLYEAKLNFERDQLLRDRSSFSKQREQLDRERELIKQRLLARHNGSERHMQSFYENDDDDDNSGDQNWIILSTPYRASASEKFTPGRVNRSTSPSRTGERYQSSVLRSPSPSRLTGTSATFRSPARLVNTRQTDLSPVKREMSSPRRTPSPLRTTSPSRSVVSPSRSLPRFDRTSTPGRGPY